MKDHIHIVFIVYIIIGIKLMLWGRGVGGFSSQFILPFSIERLKTLKNKKSFMFLSKKKKNTKKKN